MVGVDLIQMVFRDVDLYFLLAALDNGDYRSTCGHYLSYFAADVGNYAIMVCYKLGIGKLVAVGDQLGPRLPQCGSSSFHLCVILLHHGLTDAAAVIQGSVTGSVVFGQLIISFSRSHGSLAGFDTLLDILRVDAHQNFTGGDRIAQIYTAADDLTGCLKSQVAFVAAAHLARIGRCFVNGFLTNCYCADIGNFFDDIRLGQDIADDMVKQQ